MSDWRANAATDWRSAFNEANELGADHFGTLWLTATSMAVDQFRAAGYGNELERDYRLRAAIARGLFRSLATATIHPNNLARAKARMTSKSVNSSVTET